MTFQQRAKGHLAWYKRELLGVDEDGIWTRNGRRYSHILPASQQRLNILQPYREAFWEYFRTAGIKSHSDFHHLNSSQAMCFNLFFPFVEDGGWEVEPVPSLFGTQESPVEQASFEFVANQEEWTNFDFHLRLASGRRLYFELKYTEGGFAKARADAAHMRKFEVVYRSRLTGRFRPEYCTSGCFLQHYQIMRNIWSLEPGVDSVFFVYPRQNNSLVAEEGFIRECTVEPFRSQVRIVYLEELVVALKQPGLALPLRMRDHFVLFEQKYLGLDLLPNCASAPQRLAG